MRSLRYKVDELTAVLETNQIDIGCSTESWLDENIPTDSIDITNYTCYRHDGADGRRVAVLYVISELNGHALDCHSWRRLNMNPSGY